MIKHVAYSDLLWGDIKDHKISGDMGFSFCDQADTRTENIEEAIKYSEEYCLGEEAEQNCDTLSEDGTFAIYEVWEADIEMDDDYSDDQLWAGTIVEDTDKIIEVHVCATKEQAGWIEENEWYKGKGLTFKYRK